jgi:hypothetical protein
MDDLAAADLSTRRLLRRLCTSIGLDHFIGDPQLVSRLTGQLEDTAHSILLGLHPVSSRWLPKAGRLPYETPRQGSHGVPERAAPLCLQEAAPPYVSPADREELAAAGVAAAAAQLQQAGYPSLARDLEAAATRFQG